MEGVSSQPVRLSIPAHVIYSAHEYGPMEHSQPWFNASTTSTSLQALWNRRWGFIEEQGIAPLFIGEFGTSLANPTFDTTAGSQGQWFAAFIDYLQARSDVGWSYWSANAEDRYAFFESDYKNEHTDSTPFRRLLAPENQFSRRGSALASFPNRRYIPEEIRKSGNVAGERVAACRAGEKTAPRKHMDEGLESSISTNIDRATRDAMRNLPSERP